MQKRHVFRISWRRHIVCSIQMSEPHCGILMAQPTAIKTDVRVWSPRARLYGMALVITLSYMLMGRLNNDNDSWVQVNLPLSSASLLLLSLAAAEMYIYVQR